jgi:hypothetical protein
VTYFLTHFGDAPGADDDIEMIKIIEPHMVVAEPALFAAIDALR